MNKKIMKRIFTALIAVIMCFGMFSMFSITAHAAQYENDGTWISDYDTMINRGQYDRKVTIEVIVPDALRTTVYSLMENKSTGQRYFTRIENVNGYKCNIWLPMGDYVMLDVWSPVYDDFEFIMNTTDFTIKENNNGTITYTLKDLEKWVVDEYGSLRYDENAGTGNNNQNNPGNDNPGNNPGNTPGNNDNPNGNLGNDDIGGGNNNNNQGNNNNNQGSNQTPDNELTREEFIANLYKNMYDTPFDFIKMNDKAVLYYVTHYDGTSNAHMLVSGFSKKTCDAVVKITKSGILGEATFKISLDGGQTFLSDTYVAGSTTSISGTGLTISFKVPKDTDELIEGDLYTFKTIITHSVETTVSPANAMIIAVGNNPTQSFSYKVEVMSSGGLGVAKVAVYDSNLSEPRPEDKTIYVIPEDGRLELDTGVTLVFKKLDTYSKGQSFVVSVSIPETKTTDLTAAYVACGIVGFIAAVAFVILVNKKEKRADYTINEYKGYQDEDKYK